MVQKEYAGTESKVRRKKPPQALEDYEDEICCKGRSILPIGELDMWSEEELKTGTPATAQWKITLVQSAL